MLLFPANTPSFALVNGTNATPLIDAQAAKVAIATKAINKLFIRVIFTPFGYLDTLTLFLVYCFNNICHQSHK
jgi:hypothetical protein